MTNTKEKNHAISNASAWMESIKQMVADLNLDSARNGDEGFEKAQQAIHESPLSVEVRSAWYTPGDTNSALQPEEFNILLSTGGPALRIIGDLDEYGQPYSCEMQYQDWGTPWTNYDATQAEADAMLEFCQQFYFGE